MNTWGLVLAICFGVGALVTAVLLRLSASRRAVRMATLVAEGSIIWGAQVRERVGTRWGLSGCLLATATTLTLEPDKASLKRGAQAKTWPLDTIRIDLGPRRRDFTGITYRMLSLTGIGVSRDFGCVLMVGDGPGNSNA
jgi:hypothetical protein